MNVALDIGTWWIRSLRTDVHGNLIARRERAAYCVVPMRPGADESVAQLDAVPYVSHRAGEFTDAQEVHGAVLMGAEAVRNAPLLQVPCRSVFREGKLPLDEPLARQVLSVLVEGMLPEGEGTSLCRMTLPDETDRGTVEFLTRLVKLRGYTAQIIPSAMAVLLAEGVEHSLTGLAIDLGASGAKLSLATFGEETARARIGDGGAAIDRRIATSLGFQTFDRDGNRRLDVDCATNWKESVSRRTSEDQFTHLVEELHTEWVSRIWSTAAKMIREAEFERRLSVFLSGGPTALPGFGELLRTALPADFPVPVKNVRIANDTHLPVLRGLLAAGLLAETEVAAA